MSSRLLLRMSTPVRTLRAARSAPNLKRGIKNTTPAPTPSSLLSQSQYTSLSVQALKQECKHKGLKISGRKAELIDRLSSHDASRLTNMGIADVKYMSTKSSPPKKSAKHNFNAKPAKQASQQKRTQATVANELNKWKEQVDRIKLPKGWQMLEKKTKPFKIPVPPDAYSKVTKEAHTEYSTPLPDNGAGATQKDQNVHVLGKTNVRGIEGDASIEQLSRDNTDYSSGSGGGGGSESHEQPFGAKDKKFLAGFAAAVTGWWALGKVGKKNEH